MASSAAGHNRRPDLVFGCGDRTGADAAAHLSSRLAPTEGFATSVLRLLGQELCPDHTTLSSGRPTIAADSAGRRPRRTHGHFPHCTRPPRGRAPPPPPPPPRRALFFPPPGGGVPPPPAGQNCPLYPRVPT